MESNGVNDSTVLTVIIPVFNGEKTIRRTIQSVEKQKYAYNCEILVVNDGSTDNTQNILDILAQEYNNVRIITKRNGGVSDTRNCGIKNAKGKYISFLDADDFWGDFSIKN